MPPHCRRLKKTLALIEDITQTCRRRATVLTRQTQELQQELKKVMRCFGRQCRGHGHVFVKLVRHTEQKLLELGEPITALGQQAQQLLAQRRRSATPTASVSPRRSPRRCAAMRTSASNPHGSSTGKSSATVNSSMPTISPSHPSSKAREIVPRSLAASPGSCRTLPQAFSLPAVCPRGIRVIPAMCCPSLTTSRRLSNASRHRNAPGSTDGGGPRHQ